MWLKREFFSQEISWQIHGALLLSVVHEEENS